MVEKALLVSAMPKSHEKLVEALSRHGVDVQMVQSLDGPVEALAGSKVAFVDSNLPVNELIQWKEKLKPSEGKISWVWVDAKGAPRPPRELGISRLLTQESMLHDVESILQSARVVPLDWEIERAEPISASPSMRKALALVDRIADSDVPVLLLGESGTGKDVVARRIHAKSQRRRQPFIKVNCAALPSELLESELFGHDRGAFTGANADKPGKFELANRGTIFLDEIGEMDVRLQAKLLQVLQDEEYFRVGGKKYVHVDARVVVATNRNLDREIEEGRFREDLFYRLNVVSVRLLPLRERQEDIVPLVRHFLRKYNVDVSALSEALLCDMLNAFGTYHWPGNVRQLENMVRRWSVLKDARSVLEELQYLKRIKKQTAGGTPEGLKPSTFLTSSSADLHVEPECSLKDIGKNAARLAEREAIIQTLRRTGWNKRKAASKLKISYKALLYKIKESGLLDPRASSDGC